MTDELLQKAWIQSSNETIYWNKQTNDLNYESSKQLLAAAALLIPITGSIVLTSTHLNDALKVILVGSILFQFISLIFGWIDINLGINFYRKYTIYNASRATAFHKHLRQNSNFENAEQENESLAQLPARSFDLFSTLQAVFMCIGIILFVGLIITLIVYK